MQLQRTRGFTLIELLIVVAIIAILAAIAVPNFLEAQTRAKVSRAKADMRSITTAIEAYHIDNNNYPGPYEAHDQGSWDSSALTEPPFHSRIGSNITTPIAYMTSLPQDPFSTQENFLGDPPWDNGSDIAISRRFPYWNFELFTLAGLSSTTFMRGYRAAGEWLLYSPGPDRDVSNGGGSFYTPYDVTNGTVSLGNIFRTQRTPDGLDYANFLAPWP